MLIIPDFTLCIGASSTIDLFCPPYWVSLLHFHPSTLPPYDPVLTPNPFRRNQARSLLYAIYYSLRSTVMMLACLDWWAISSIISSRYRPTELIRYAIDLSPINTFHSCNSPHPSYSGIRVAHTYAHITTHTHAPTGAHTRTHARTHALTHARTHARTHAHTHTHTHTNTHAHTHLQ